jgi:hypothetical protein
MYIRNAVDRGDVDLTSFAEWDSTRVCNSIEEMSARAEGSPFD